MTKETEETEVLFLLRTVAKDENYLEMLKNGVVIKTGGPWSDEFTKEQLERLKAIYKCDYTVEKIQ